MEKAGVLHRDVSIGNILIVDKPHPSIIFHGFLHDCDYSSMDVDEPSEDSSSDVETDYGSESSDEAEEDSSESDSDSPLQDVPPNLKERTVCCLCVLWVQAC